MWRCIYILTSVFCGCRKVRNFINSCKHKNWSVLNGCDTFILAPKDFYIFGFPMVWQWEYLMEVTPENATSVHWFRYLDFLFHYEGIIVLYTCILWFYSWIQVLRNVVGYICWLLLSDAISVWVVVPLLVLYTFSYSYLASLIKIRTKVISSELQWLSLTHRHLAIKKTDDPD